jgi:glycosyl transferase family 61
LAVLFPTFRAWKNAQLAWLRYVYRRFRLIGTGMRAQLALRIEGATTAHSAFSGEGAVLVQQRATRATDQQSMFRWMIYPAQTDQLALPKTIESGDAGGFAQCKTVHRPAMYVYRIANGLYHGDRGAVIDNQQRVLRDLLDAPPGPLHEPLTKTEPFFCSGKAMVLSSSRNYFHWLIKMLPRLHLFEHTGLLPTGMNVVLINDPTPAQGEGYARARLPAGSLRIVGRRDFWRCRQLYISSIPHDVPPWAVAFLRKLFGPLSPADNAGAVYLMRGATTRRRVQNESDICEHLAKRGIAAVDLSRRSFVEQMQIIGNAGVIVAPHGSALANLVFARTGTRVLEIFANPGNQKCYWMLARHRQLSYHYFLADAVPNGHNPNEFDMVIRREKLDRALDFLMRTKECLATSS